MPSSDKLERLLKLTATLLETRRPLAAREIQTRVEGYSADLAAFRRQFERDKKELKDLGIPILIADIPASDPPDTGYRIPPDQYYLRDPGLTDDEMAALQLAASAVRVEGVDSTGALWKLGGVRERMLSRTAGEVTAVPVDERLVTLWGAINEHAPVTFAYRDEERHLDPYRLQYVRGRWYVDGFDHDRVDERQFRLDRMGPTVTTGQPGSFERPSTDVPGGTRESWQLGGGDPVVAEVRFDPDVAPIALGVFGPAAVLRRDDDGSVVTAVGVANPAGFRSFLFSFLDHCEVLGPPELRDDVVGWLQAIVDRRPSEVDAR
jgi:proteasome accessory factor B